MVHDFHRSRRRQPSGLWMFDVALVLLSTLAMTMVLRLMRFDDPRVLHNAWTYFIGVPTVLIISSMLARVLVSEQFEKSIQIGFLGSVAIHLMFTFAAINLVIFRGVWEDGMEKVELIAQAESRASQFVDTEISRGTERPDYLRPVETEWVNPSQVDVEPARPRDAILEPSKLELEDQVQPDEAAYNKMRAAASISQPTVSSASRNLDRPTLSSRAEPKPRTIELPSLSGAAAPTGDLLPDRPIEQKRLETATESLVRETSDRPDTQFETPSSQPVSLPRGSRAAAYDTVSELDNNMQRAASEMNSLLPRPTTSKPRSMADRKSDVPVPQIEPVEAASEAESVALETLGNQKSNVGRTQDSGLINRAPLDPEAWNAIGERMGSGTSTPAMLPSRAASPQNDPTQALLSDSSNIGPSVPDRTQRPGTMQSGGVRRPIPIPVTGSIGESVGGTRADSAANNTDPSFAVLDRTGASSRRVERSGDSLRKEGKGTAREAGSEMTMGPVPLPAASTSSLFKGDLRAGLAPLPRDLGLPDIRPSEIQLDRFRRKDLGGPIRQRSAVPVPAPAFKQRLRRNEDAANDEVKSLGELGPQTEEAIERGLEFLAQYQRPEGAWHLNDFGKKTRMQSDTAATALALLSFQGAGYSHEQFKYQATCKRAIDWLRSIQKKNGDLYASMDEASDVNAWLYSHAIATLAMCEAYGMTQDEAIRDSAQRAVDFLVDSQDPVAGGWRYTPRIGSDTSVTGWAMMALKSAELAGLKVPPETYAGITKWLNSSEASARERYLYRYNWQASTPQTQHGRIPTPVMTSVGLLMRLYLGWRRTNPDMARGTDWLLERPPAFGTPQVPLRDTYYWYYATQVMFHMGGERWRSWYSRLYPMLISTQELQGPYAGSWDPEGDIPDAWGEYGGRLYVTTMNLLSLEVTYRHLPIYEATAP
ncbi:MAG: prenyltransferase/squalene oxidase repeat-containing protein [Planctomycetota bacterium]